MEKCWWWGYLLGSLDSEESKEVLGRGGGGSWTPVGKRSRNWKSKLTCDKPKAEGRRPESASEASSIQPEVYSSRSEHLPEAPTCIRPRVHWPEVYSSIREVNWVYVKSRKVEENSRKSPERVQKKSRKSPEKDQNHPRVCFRKV